jgi:hypothetical protein
MIMNFPTALNDFRDYVHMFYGRDAIYDLGCGIPDIQEAIIQYAVKCMDIAGHWGGGDSVDRERVRAILEDMGFKEIDHTKAEGGDLMNDLAMLIEAKECYNETYYNSEYKRITNRLIELNGYNHYS